MQGYKEDCKTIIEVSGYLSLILLLIMINHPLIASISGLFWFCTWSYGIYVELRYRNTEHQNEIRFSTQNDLFHRMTQLILGSMAVVGTIVWIFLMTTFTFLPIIGLIAGILLLLRGVLNTPSGHMNLENGKLSLGREKQSFESNDICSILIGRDQIRMESRKGAVVKLEGLDLSERMASEIMDFLNLRLVDSTIEISLGNEALGGS